MNYSFLESYPAVIFTALLTNKSTKSEQLKRIEVWILRIGH